MALEVLTGLASLQSKRGDVEHALELLLLVLNHPASFQDTQIRAAHLRTELEARLTPQQIESAQAHAQTTSLDRVIEQILGQVREVPSTKT